MIEVKAPERYEHNPDQRTVFLAGGITNCPDWQREISKALAEIDVVLLNPRRDKFDIANPAIEQEQIEWEHQHLLQANSYLFWFCEETVCPIALFELGKVAGLFPTRSLFVGTHPKYSRKRDINFQMLLMRPEVSVVHHLDRLTEQIIEWAKRPPQFSRCRSNYVSS